MENWSLQFIVCFLGFAACICGYFYRELLTDFLYLHPKYPTHTLITCSSLNPRLFFSPTSLILTNMRTARLLSSALRPGSSIRALSHAKASDSSLIGSDEIKITTNEKELKQNKAPTGTC